MSFPEFQQNGSTKLFTQGKLAKGTSMSPPHRSKGSFRLNTWTFITRRLHQRCPVRAGKRRYFKAFEQGGLGLCDYLHGSHFRWEEMIFFFFSFFFPPPFLIFSLSISLFNFNEAFVQLLEKLRKFWTNYLQSCGFFWEISSRKG